MVLRVERHQFNVKMGDELVKPTGYVRKVDQLGRILVPKYIRHQYGMERETFVEMFVDEDQIIFEKYEPGCVVCGDSDDVTLVKGKRICGQCRVELAAL